MFLPFLVLLNETQVLVCPLKAATFVFSSFVGLRDSFPLDTNLICLPSLPVTPLLGRLGSRSAVSGRVGCAWRWLGLPQCLTRGLRGRGQPAPQILGLASRLTQSLLGHNRDVTAKEVREK